MNRLLDIVSALAWFAFFLLLACAFVWRAHGVIIPPNNTIDFTKAGVVGGIPNSSTMTVFTTFTATATSGMINKAVQTDCPSNQVVALAAGTYTLTSLINMTKDGVVLRGAGASNTILKINNSGYAAIRVSANYNDVNSVDPPNVANWTSGFSKGTTVIGVSSASGMAVGRMLCLDQLNAPGVDGGGQEGCSYCGRGSASGGFGPRAQFQGVTVSAINGTSITISPGIYMTNIASSRTPQAWCFNNNPRQKCGIESLTITNTGASGNNISLEMANNCWVSNVVCLNNWNDHVRTYFATHCQVSHSSFFGAVAGQENYGVNFYYGWDNLAENNIFEGIAQPMVIETGSQGNVFFGNYATNLANGDPTWLWEGGMAHAAGVCMNLWEANWYPHAYVDRIHGGGVIPNVWLRNRITGYQPLAVGSTHAVAVQYTNHYESFVGNILGTAGWHLYYQCASVCADADKSIYFVGYDGSSDAHPYDSGVTNTMIRHGNWDTVSLAQVWDPNISDRTIPITYAVNNIPAWWGNLGWPAYNPTNITAAFIDATNIPAGYRYVFHVDPSALPIVPRSLRVTGSAGFGNVRIQ